MGHWLILQETITMHIVLNGADYPLETPLTVAALLDQLGLGQKRVAVELNLHIVPRSQHSQVTLQHGDRVEVVEAIGGGSFSLTPERTNA